MNEHLIIAMVEYLAGDPAQIQHFMKVQSFALAIAKEERAGADAEAVLEAAAVVHDIGVKVAKELFGESSAELQQELGPGAAEEFLRRLHLPEEIVLRAAWLTGHIHSYDSIGQADHQILVEANLLAGFYDENMPAEQIRLLYDKVFRTETGRKLCHEMYGV